MTLGFSPCPNDTFIFDAMVHHKIDTEGLEFEVVMEDVEALNRRALKAELDITKLSYHAFGHCMPSYVLLDSGSALGNGCGPLLIANKTIAHDNVQEGKIAVPGKYTTANFLFSIFFPKAADKAEMVFNEIENAVINEKVIAGVIIHENRFTYQDRGLVKVADLGEMWEHKTKMPIPLGGIVVRRSMPKSMQMRINRVLRRSVEYALHHPNHLSDYVRCHAQEMDETVMKAHIALYVNDFTVHLGRKGRAAVRNFLMEGIKKHIIPDYNLNYFIN